MIYSACEYMLYAKKNELNEADVTFVPAKIFSPYMECLPTEISHKLCKKKQKIEVNPIYRYGEIFSNLLTIENEESLKELQNFIFDFWLHEVFRLECLSGMTRKAFAKSCLISEIIEGFLGEKNRNDFELFRKEEQNALMSQVINLYSGGDCGILFCGALKIIFGDIYIYMLLDDKKILLYVGQKESSVVRKKIFFIKDIFLPMGTQMDIFWNKHFGVFGVEETMVLDEIALI